MTSLEKESLLRQIKADNPHYDVKTLAETFADHVNNNTPYTPQTEEAKSIAKLFKR